MNMSLSWNSVLILVGIQFKVISIFAVKLIICTKYCVDTNVTAVFCKLIIKRIHLVSRLEAEVSYVRISGFIPLLTLCGDRHPDNTQIIYVTIHYHSVPRSLVPDVAIVNL